MLRGVSPMLVGGFAAPAGGSDPNWTSVKLLVGANGTHGSTTFIDESSVGRTLTAVGNAQITTTSPLIGSGSILLDGTTDSITAPSHADWNMAVNEAFTIEGFLKLAATGADWGAFSRFEGSFASFALYFEAGNLIFRFYDTGITGRDTTGAYTPTTSQVHIAVDRTTGGVVRTYIDGVVIGTATFAQAFYENGDVFRIGSRTAAALSVNGRMDEVRFTKGVARYAGAFTPPTTAFPRS